MKTIGLIEGARSLEKGGADFALICTNTMHKLYDEVQAQIQIPLMHIADATAEANELPRGKPRGINEG